MDFPMKHGDFPMKHGDFPIKNASRPATAGAASGVGRPGRACHAARGARRPGTNP